MEIDDGWKSMGLSVKLLFIVLVFWTIGSFFAVPMRFELGLPFFGLYVYGIIASLIVVVLDIVAPFIFLFGLWNRKSWAPYVGYSYMVMFILNSIVTLFLFREQLGTVPIIIPMLFTIVFICIIYGNRDYFEV